MPYLLRRFGHAIFLLIGVSVLAFVFTVLAPGNYFDEMRLNPQIAPESIVALKTQYEVDRPLPVRYLHWVGSVLRGDMGFSFAYNRPVAPLLFIRARNTLLLTSGQNSVPRLLTRSKPRVTEPWINPRRAELSRAGYHWLER